MRKIIIALTLLILLSGCGSETKKSEFTTNESGIAANVQVESDSLDCKENFDCFKEAAAECKKSKTSVSYKMEAMGIKQDMKFYFEIKGEEGDKCVIYEKIEDYKFEFTEEFTKQMSSYGMAEADIQKQLDASEAQAAQVIGKDITCKVPMSQLTGSLSEKGLDTDLSQCTGSLLEVKNSLTTNLNAAE